jgi:peptidoglycan hydrolase-like amidase
MSKAFLALLFVFSSLIPTAYAQDVPATFSFQGSGYGHGVGLSQMGARYMALAGQSPEQIIKYYYKDVAIEQRDDSKILRVNIGHLLTTAKISTATKGSQLQIIQGEAGNESVLPVSSLADSISFSIIGSTVSPRVTLGKTTQVLTRSRTFTIRWAGTRYLEGPDTLISVNHSGVTQKLRYGQIQVKAIKTPSGYRIAMTNSVRLADEYLWGISEMPSFWPVAALEAQALASRTYALSKAVVWKDIVTRTAGLTITQAGLPITAYFSSSSGGKTELAVNAWGSSRDYTQIVDDPGSLDLALNPRFVTWNREVPQSVIAAAFVLPDVVSLEILGINESGTVAQIQATSSSGVKVALRGETFRSRTKIPSAWFSLVSVQN